MRARQPLENVSSSFSSCVVDPLVSPAAAAARSSILDRPARVTCRIPTDLFTAATTQVRLIINFCTFVMRRLHFAVISVSNRRIAPTLHERADAAKDLSSTSTIRARDVISFRSSSGYETLKCGLKEQTFHPIDVSSERFREFSSE